jgi:protein-arginine kinase activator protein McsA
MNKNIKNLFDTLIQEAAKNQLIKICSNCNLTLAELFKKGRVGCEHCYVIFENELKSLIHMTQKDAYEHVGKKPKKIHNETLIYFLENKLNNLLQISIKQEDYLQAAKINKDLSHLNTIKKEKSKLIEKLKISLESGDYSELKCNKEELNSLYNDIREEFSFYIL